MRAKTVCLLLAVVALRGLAACVDGVTPDCSNPAVCSPSEGPVGPLDASTGDSSRAADASSTSDAKPADGG